MANLNESQIIKHRLAETLGLVASQSQSVVLTASGCCGWPGPGWGASELRGLQGCAEPGGRVAQQASLLIRTEQVATPAGVYRGQWRKEKRWPDSGRYTSWSGVTGGTLDHANNPRTTRVVA